MADTELGQLVINELTKAQYEALTPEANQLYVVTDDPPLCSGDNVSELVNDAGYLTQHQSLAAYSTTAQMNAAISAYHDTQKQDVVSDLSTIRSGAAAGATAYQKPATGVPLSDLNASVQTSIGKADTALQSHQDISGKEDKSNKSTAITSASTDTQYPSAKAVYDAVDEVKEDIADLGFSVVNGQLNTTFII